MTLGASGNTSLNDVTAKGGLTLTGGTIGFGDVAGATIDMASTGSLIGGRVTSSGAIGVKGGSVQLAVLSGGGTVNAMATGGDLALSGPVTGSDVSLGATGNAALGQVTASGGLSISGGSVGFGDAAGTSITVASAGAVNGISIKATNAASINGASVTLGSATGGSVGLSATSGDLNVSGPITGSDVTLGATGNAALGQVTASGALVINGGSVGFSDAAGASVTIASAVRSTVIPSRPRTPPASMARRSAWARCRVYGRPVRHERRSESHGPVTGTDVTLGATGKASMTQVTASGALKLTGGNVAFGDIAGASIDGRPAGRSPALRRAPPMPCRCAEGRSASTAPTAGAGLALSATGGDLSLGSLTSGGDAVLTAKGRPA